MADAPEKQRNFYRTSASFSRFVPQLISSRPNPFAQPLTSISSAGDKERTSSGVVFQNPSGGANTLRYNTGRSITALDANADRDRVALAGREVLKILKVSNHAITEEIDLRIGAKLNTSFASNDVKWGLGETKNVIATAAGNGQILLWDLEKPSANKPDKTLKEHTRAVNSIAFNPANGKWLLSASQDGSIKFWDVKDPNMSRTTLHAKGEGVRDVQFSPRDGVQFAAAFDNGTIQVWDIRTRNVLRTFHGHNGPALTIDWHPDGKRLASGGRDKLAKIWDSTSESRRPRVTIQTSAPVAMVSWRPYSQNQSTRRSAAGLDLATCSLSYDKRILVWDLRRPYIAAQVLEEHSGITTGFLWRDDSTLWSCSKDKTFVQHNLSMASRQINALSQCAVAWSPRNEVAFAIDERSKAQEVARFERTLSSEDVDERRKHSRSSSFITGRRGSTVFSALDWPLEHYKPSQTSGFVAFEAASTQRFVALASEYVISVDETISLPEACDLNAQAAFRIQKYRASQTWRMIATILRWDNDPNRGKPLQATKTVQHVPKADRSQSERSSRVGGDTPLAHPRQSPLTHAFDRNPTQVTSRMSSLNLSQQQSPAKVTSNGSEVFTTEEIATPTPNPGEPMLVPPGSLDSLDFSEKSASLKVASWSIPNITMPSDSTPEQPLQSIHSSQNHSLSVSSSDATRPPTYGSDSNAFPQHRRRNNNEPSVQGFQQEDLDEESDGDENFDLEQTILCKPLVLGSSALERGVTYSKETGDQVPKPWALKRLVRKIANYYSEHGDVQMCVTLAILLAERVALPKRIVDEWTSLYIGKRIYYFQLTFRNSTKVSLVCGSSRGHKCIPIYNNS